MAGPLDAARYLAELSRMDPVREAASMIELRNRFIGLEGPPAPAERRRPDEEPDREAMADAVGRIRAGFWESEASDVSAALAELGLGDYPDLLAAARQMQRVAALRRQFDRAARDVDPKFMEAFRRIAVAPPDEAVVMRDKFVRRLVASAAYRRARDSTKTIRRRFPELFEVEADWLSLILRLKKERKLAAGVGKSWFAFIVVYIIIRLIMRLFGE
jgi:hypothetical protein